MEIDVLHIAKLANIRLDEKEIALFSHQISGIVDMISALPEIEGAEDVVSERAMPLRKDEVQKSLSRERILMNAPEASGGCFAVPKTVE